MSSGYSTDKAGHNHTDGPTFEEYVAAGYAPESYPPFGYDEKPSAGLTAYRESKATATKATDAVDALVPDPIPAAASEVPAGDVPTADAAPVVETTPDQGSGRKRK